MAKPRLSADEREQIVLPPVHIDALKPVEATSIAFASPRVQRTTTKRSTRNVLGVCDVAGLRDDDAENRLDLLPVLYANMYFAPKKSLTIRDEAAKLTVVQRPKHGEIKLGRTSTSDADYLPARGYLGTGTFGIARFTDTFAVRVEGDGKVVTLRYFVLVTAESGWTVGQMGRDVKECRNVSPEWNVFKISRANSRTDIGPVASLETGIALSEPLARAGQAQAGVVDLRAAPFAPIPLCPGFASGAMGRLQRSAFGGWSLGYRALHATAA